MVSSDQAKDRGRMKVLVTDPHLRRACEQVTIAPWDTPLKVAVTGLLVSLVMMENRGSEVSDVFPCLVS